MTTFGKILPYVLTEKCEPGQAPCSSLRGGELLPVRGWRGVQAAAEMLPQCCSRLPSDPFCNQIHGVIRPFQTPLRCQKT